MYKTEGLGDNIKNHIKMSGLNDFSQKKNNSGINGRLEKVNVWRKKPEFCKTPELFHP